MCPVTRDRFGPTGVVFVPALDEPQHRGARPCQAIELVPPLRIEVSCYANIFATTTVWAHGGTYCRNYHIAATSRETVRTNLRMAARAVMGRSSHPIHTADPACSHAGSNAERVLREQARDRRGA